MARRLPRTHPDHHASDPGRADADQARHPRRVAPGDRPGGDDPGGRGGGRRGRRRGRRGRGPRGRHGGHGSGCQAGPAPPFTVTAWLPVPSARTTLTRQTTRVPSGDQEGRLSRPTSGVWSSVPGKASAARALDRDQTEPALGERPADGDPRAVGRPVGLVRVAAHRPLAAALGADHLQIAVGRPIGRLDPARAEEAAAVGRPGRVELVGVGRGDRRGSISSGRSPTRSVHTSVFPPASRT